MAVKRSQRLMFGCFGLVVFLALLELAADVMRYARSVSATAVGTEAPGGEAPTPSGEQKGESPLGPPKGKGNPGPGGQQGRRVVFRVDEYLRGAMDPNQVGTVLRGWRVSTNSHGLRGPEPQERSHRVVCIGDSVTFGWDSHDDGTYPHFLGKALADVDVDVVNAGMPRFSSMALLNLYVAKVQALKPDIVVLLVGWNDIGFQFLTPAKVKPAQILQAEKAAAAAQLVEPTPIAADAFSMVYLVRVLLKSLQTPDAEEIIQARENTTDQIAWRHVPTYRRIVENLIALIRANGSMPVLVTMPHYLKADLSDADKKRMLPYLVRWPGVSIVGWFKVVTRVNNTIRAVAKSLDVPLIECERAVEAELFTDIVHMNRRGNQLLAERIAAGLRPIIKELPR